MSYLPLRRTWMWQVRKMQEHIIRRCTWMWQVRKMQEHIIRRRTWMWQVRKMQERFSAEYMDVGNAGIA